MSDSLPPDPSSPPNGPNRPPEGGGSPSGFGPPQGGGYGGPPDGGGFGGPPPGGGAFGGPPPGGGAFGGPAPGRGMHPAPPPPKASSSTKGCLIAVAVLFGIGALCTCTGLGIVGFAVYDNPELRRGFAAMGDVWELMREGMEDPGAQALVGAGCQQAIAFPLGRFVEIMREVDPENAPEIPGADAPELVVTCTLGSTPKTCDELARVFASAHTPTPASFALTVQSFPGNQQLCANLYGSAGELIRPLTEDEQFDMPAAPPSGGQPPLPLASPK